MPLCTSLQYPLQNRAKVQKKIEIYKKNQQNTRFFKSCTCLLYFLSAQACLLLSSEGWLYPKK